MSTLLELVKDLEWPEGAVCAVQDKDGAVKWLPSMPCSGCREFGGSSTSPDIDGCWWFLSESGLKTGMDCDSVCHINVQPLSSDWDSSVVTKEMWETVQPK